MKGFFDSVFSGRRGSADANPPEPPEKSESAPPRKWKTWKTLHTDGPSPIPGRIPRLRDAITDSEIDLTRVSPEDFGFTDSPSAKDFLEAVFQDGLSVCPRGVGQELFLLSFADDDSSETDPTYIIEGDFSDADGDSSEADPARAIEKNLSDSRGPLLSGSKSPVYSAPIRRVSGASGLTMPGLGSGSAKTKGWMSVIPLGTHWVFTPAK